MSIFTKHILLLIFVLYAINSVQEDIIEHKVAVNHPAFEKEDPTSFLLKEIRVKDGSSEFYLEVESVICVDHLCKIVPVRIYWNSYGEYLKYELDQNIQLEKGEGEPFIEEDYQLLHKILKDRNSPYKDISYYEITHERIIGESQADAISGATEVVLKTGETVIGAAWTCFTLWHWAHGDMVQEIRRITGSKLNAVQLLKNLNSSVGNYQIFALNELAKRKTYDSVHLESLIKNAPNASKKINKYVLKYIEQAPPEIYYEFMGRIYSKANKENRLLYLGSLLASKNIGNSDSYNVYIKNLTLLSFQEVDLLFQVLDQTRMSPPQLDQLSILLNHENFIISRRAYWFLVNQNPAEFTKTKIQEFYIQNKEKL